MQFLVSIIVPVYKVEPYLQRCLDSLCKQSLTEIEIVLIDDASPDHCGVICDEYSARDARFHVIHNTTNQGLSVARNIGIVNSSAPYVMFVDSDDYVHEDFCKAAYDCAMRYQADLVLFRYAKLNIKNKLLSIPHSEKTQRSGNKTRYEAIDLMLRDMGSWAWNKLYKRELFEEVTYPAGYYYEDLGTTYKLIWKASHVYYLNKILYYYCSHSGSITKLKTKKNVQDSFFMQLQQYQGLVAYGYPKERMKSVLLNLAMSYCMMVKPDSSDSHYAFYAFVLRNGKINQSDLVWKRKILLFLFKYCFVLFELVCNLYSRKFNDCIRVLHLASSVRNASIR